MIPIGINGFGRIGKCIFIQLIDHPIFNVKAINAPDIDIKYIESYLKNDSVHKYNKKFVIEIVNSNNFKINGKIVHIFQDRDAKYLSWKDFKIDHVIDATGCYLTSEKAKHHNVNHVIMSAPPKDNTPSFVYGVNHNKYNGEQIISNASCTTNCITPVLKFLDDKYGIKNANFTTIHATTSSQTTIDTLNSNNRTHRSILNNIIPHSTGASSAIFELIPSLIGKIYGTSLRVPVNNVSIVDLNVELDKNTTINDIMNEIKNHNFIKLVDDNLVSSDFMTSVYPSIVDKKASMHLGENRFKLLIWYDNEWSYSAQIIRLLEHITTVNYSKKSYYIENFNFKNKKVILRVDWNIPTKNGKILDDFRIVSSLPTINRIMNDKPDRLIIISHFGRPEKKMDIYSWYNYLEQLQKYFTDEIHFLKDGLSEETLIKLDEEDEGKCKCKGECKCKCKDKGKGKLYLLENIRFHDQETNYKNYPEDNFERLIISKLGDFYVNDAFGCCHRDHLSICGVKTPEKAYGYLIDQEVKALKILMENKDNKKILAIIGGAKFADKLPLVEALSMKMNNIYIGGGNINGIIKNDMNEYMEKIRSNKANIYLMKDGLCASSLNEMPSYQRSNNLDDSKFFYDIGMESIIDLEELIMSNDVIFWNGSMGITENDLYKHGSIMLLNLLIRSGKKVIIGGGNTVQFVNQYEHNFFYVSTGGGSTIDYISNGSLVGIDFFN